MTKTLIRLLTLSAVVGLIFPVTAIAADIGVGVTGGTTGISVEVKVAPAKRLMLRGSYNFAELSGEIVNDDINYDGDFTLSNFGAFADIAPFGNAFILSGGAYIGEKAADLVATPSANVSIGNQVFTPTQVGSLFGRAEFNEVAPYVGLGFDNFQTTSGPWSFNARAGVMFVGSADVVELTSADGLLSSDSMLLTELRTEIASIEEDVEDYKYFPVVTLGITRKF